MEPLLPVLPRGSGLVPAGPAESESQWPGGGLDAARHREHRLPRRVGHFSPPSRPACRRGRTNQTVTTAFASGSRCGQFKSSR
jgi:hypothetical protein